MRPSSPDTVGGVLDRLVGALAACDDDLAHAVYELPSVEAAITSLKALA